MKALILIGGEGTRLRPLTFDIPKCMAPVANRQFIEYQVNLLKKYGIKDIILGVSHMPLKVKKALGNGKKYGVTFRYAGEKNPLGTGGAIKNCGKMLDDTTVVLNGDILTDIRLDELLKAHKKSKALVTLALHEAKDTSSYGLVKTGAKNRVVKFTEKPAVNSMKQGWINAGIYIFQKEALDFIPEGRKVSVERETFPEIIAAGSIVQAYKADYYWLDIGRIENYMKANFDVVEGGFSGMKIKTRGKKCSIGTAAINSSSVIGDFVSIGNGVIIENSVILDNTKIKDGSVIKNSLICPGCVINENCYVVNTALGGGSVLTKYTKYGV